MVDNTFRWPDFFIVGAPKCGTTALASYLSEHPDVLMSNPKEPHFFCTDMNLGEKSRPANTIEKYRACFGDSNEAIRVGEASVFYLYSRTAIPEILEVQPRAKFLVFLRNPVEMAISLHQQFARNLWENLPFRDAWNCSVNNAIDRPIPAECPWPGMLNYYDLCRVGEQTERLMGLVSRSNIDFVLFDWIKEDTASVYRQIMRTLEIEDDGRDSFPVINPAQATRWPALRRALSSLERVKRSLGVENNFGTTRLLRRVNLKRVNPHIGVGEELRCEMRKQFNEDVVLLESLTGLPVVSMWGFE